MPAGDVFLRVRSKVLSKKWKPVTFQVNGLRSEILSFATMNDWMGGYKTYFRQNIHPHMRLGAIELKEYEGVSSYCDVCFLSSSLSPLL